MLEEHQTSIINRSASLLKDKIGGYRFINNKRIGSKMLNESLYEQCSQNSKNLHLVCLQDTTEYNYQHHIGRLQENTLGIVGNNHDNGFFAHLMLSFDAHSCLPLGISYARLWGRDKNKKDKHQRNYHQLPIEEKESYRWIEAAEQSKERMGLSRHITFVSDRESDIYQLWSRIPDKKTDLIIRARTDRRLYDQPITVNKLLEQLPSCGQYTIDLKTDKRKNRNKGMATLDVKYSAIKIKKPGSVKGDNANDRPYVNMYVVQAKQQANTLKEGEAPICWALFTTHKIESFEQASQIIQWYSFRWQIEQFFRITKKKGIDIESSQLETGEGLMKLAIMGFAVSLKILQLSLARNGTPNDKAVKYFTPQQVIMLELLIPQLEGSTKKQQNPFEEYTLSWASWIIARLGGYSGYKSQSPPGPITYKWGLDRFNNMVKGFILMKDVYKE